MRNLQSLALLALLLAPLATPAADLTFELGGMVEYDDNAFRRGGEEDDDVLFRFRPQVKLHEDRGEDVRYSVYYAVPFEFAVDHGDELDDIDHEAGGDLTYRVNDRLEFYGTERFRYLRGPLIDVRVEDALAGEGTLLINQERDRVTLNTAEAGASYRFTPRLSGNLSLMHELFDPEREDRAENWLLSGTGSLNYVLTPRHTVGFGARVIRQEFEDRRNIPGSEINTYNAFLQWILRWDETLEFSVSAGPTLIDSMQDDPDTSTVVPTIPFANIGVGTNLGALGLVNEDGSPATGTVVNDGSIVVTQLDACGEVDSRPVFNQDLLCGATASAPAVFLDALDDGAIITDVQTPQTIVDNAAEGEDDTRLSYFASVVVAKHWTETLHTALRYDRSQGGASGLGGAVIRDTVSLSNTWSFAERWQLALRGDWSLRQSVVDEGAAQFVEATDGNTLVGGFSGGVVPAGTLRLITVKGGASSDIDTMRYGVAGRLTHRFLRNTSGYVQLTYNEQTSENRTLGETSDFDDFLAVVGVRHVFDPIKLW